MCHNKKTRANYSSVLRPKVSSESNHDDAAAGDEGSPTIAPFEAIALLFALTTRPVGRVLVGGPPPPLPEPGVFLTFAA